MCFICPCIATPASTEKVGFSNTLKKQMEQKHNQKTNSPKKPHDMKNHQHKRNKKQTNTNVEFPKCFCFCAHFFFYCFCDFGFLDCFLLFALVWFFSKTLYSLCWSTQNHCIPKRHKNKQITCNCFWGKRTRRTKHV